MSVLIHVPYDFGFQRISSVVLGAQIDNFRWNWTDGCFACVADLGGTSDVSD